MNHLLSSPCLASSKIKFSIPHNLSKVHSPHKLLFQTNSLLHSFQIISIHNSIKIPNHFISEESNFHPSFKSNTTKTFAYKKRKQNRVAVDESTDEESSDAEKDFDKSNESIKLLNDYDRDLDIDMEEGFYDIEKEQDFEIYEDEEYWSFSSLKKSKNALNEIDLRLMFMEEVALKSRHGDSFAVGELIKQMEMIGLKITKRIYHALIVSYIANNDIEGAIHGLRCIVNSDQTPLYETFVALAKFLGRSKEKEKGEALLAFVEENGENPRVAWMAYVEELWHAGEKDYSVEMFLKGATNGLTPADKLTDMLVEGNCKMGDHGNALDILDSLMKRGVYPTTFHYNCLIMAQANAGLPQICLQTLDTMKDLVREQLKPMYYDSKPDTETYNWCLQAYTRQKYLLTEQVVELVGRMVEDYERVQPNMRTYALLVELYSKAGLMNESIRHFQAMKRVEGSIHSFFLDVKEEFGNPLTVFLRSLCRTGIIDVMLDVLKCMDRDNVMLPAGAMLEDLKGRRTLVTSWMEPLGEEPDYGYEIDYIARWNEDQDRPLDGRDWKVHRGEWRKKEEDVKGFWSVPQIISFLSHCESEKRQFYYQAYYKIKLLGPAGLSPGATKEDAFKVLMVLNHRLTHDLKLSQRKPKAASKLLVGELRQELAAQGLSVEGTRPILYQRLQKARKLNIARGLPLWLPPDEEEPNFDDARINYFVENLDLKGLYSSFLTYKECKERADLGLDFPGPVGSPDWDYGEEKEVKRERENEERQNAGEGEEKEDKGEEGEKLSKGIVGKGKGLSEEGGKEEGENEDELEDELEDTDEDDTDDEEDDEEDEEEEEEMTDEEEEEEEEDDDEEKVRKKSNSSNSLLAQLVKKQEEALAVNARDERILRLKKGRLEEERRRREMDSLYIPFIDESRPLLPQLPIENMMTLAEAWKHEWEMEDREKSPLLWSKELELHLSHQIFNLVMKLGGKPSYADCAVVIRRAMEVEDSEIMVEVLNKSHELGYVYGRPLYENATQLCVKEGMNDLASEIIELMEAVGCKAEEDFLKNVLESSQTVMENEEM